MNKKKIQNLSILFLPNFRPMITEKQNQMFIIMISIEGKGHANKKKPGEIVININM